MSAVVGTHATAAFSTILRNKIYLSNTHTRDEVGEHPSLILHYIIIVALPKSLTNVAAAKGATTKISKIYMHTTQ